MAIPCSSLIPKRSTYSYFCAIGASTAERAQRRCFCIDVTCDNLLDAVKQTVEEETMALIKHLGAELMTNLKEYEIKEQSLAAEVAAAEGQNLLAPHPLFRGTKNSSMNNSF